MRIGVFPIIFVANAPMIKSIVSPTLSGTEAEAGS
jgi:hypothetical protein